MSSAARINENGHLAPGYEPPSGSLNPQAGNPAASQPVNADPIAWNTLHDMLDMLLEGGTEEAMRASAKLTLHEIRRYADAVDELRTILTARIAVRYMEMQPEIRDLLQKFMPHLVDNEPEKGAGE